MATPTQAPTGLDEDPKAYLALPRFNHTLDFDLELPGAESRTASVSYALTDVPPDASWPVLIFFNGLGGHRIIAALTEGIARAHNVQLLTLDKPGAGGSFLGVPIPLAARTRWMHAALLAVLAHEHIPRFAVLSHSNGLFYALYTLLHLPPPLTLPAGPSPAPSWSGGLLSSNAGMLSAPVGPAEQEARKPPHKRGYVHRHVNAACRAAVMRRAMRESRVAMGQEALFTLHGGEAAPVAAMDGGGGESDSVWNIGGGATDMDVLRGAPPRRCAAAARRLRRRGRAGAGAGAHVAEGRAGDRGAAAWWKEVPEAGHDDVLFLEEVVGAILGRVE
ncbi:hypothetical protein C8F04DRAFT_1237915 [Mycena alexandri]|uniref:Uncharacterized protein n=1 Tax=Mycena alexandri TaxID=1745969 RepID=A0AAD6SHV1_9AGAR|nr:hypothetical protein C8F04DRAFT_1237915 [Mycena alexandri]